MIAGTATTPETDRQGDVVEPLGVTYKNPLPLLLYHDAKKPVGRVTFKTPTKNGIDFTASLPMIDETGALRDRVEEAWQSIKAGLLGGVSIGFRAIETAFDKSTGGIHFLKSEVLELSLVAIPANSQATIASIKSFDQPAAAASGTSRTVPSSPGATGSRSGPIMTISEQLTAEKANLQIKSARLAELELADEQGTIEEGEIAERDTLAKDVPTLTAKVGRLGAIEAAEAAQAGTIVAAPSRTVTRTAPRVEVVERTLAKGTLFARYAMAVAAGKGSMSDTLAYAKRFTDTPEVLQYIKAVEGTSTGTSPGWGAELVYQQNLASEFVELLRAATVLGRISGLRNVPFNVRIPVQEGGSTVNWVGESAVKPVSQLEFGTVTLGYDKIAGIVVLTEELVRLSSPSAEEVVRRDLIEQIARFIDEQLLLTTVTAGANNPASLTNGISSPAASGTDAASLMSDFNTALATFDNADMGTDTVVIIMTPALARGISTLLTALGGLQFPTMTPTGGTLMGYPVLVSSSCPSGSVIFIKANEILLADDGRVTLDASNQATLDMAGGSAPDFSLWQKNCIGIRAERWITWKKRRSDAVAMIDTASYGPTAGTP